MVTPSEILFDLNIAKRNVLNFQTLVRRSLADFNEGRTTNKGLLNSAQIQLNIWIATVARLEKQFSLIKVIAEKPKPTRLEYLTSKIKAYMGFIGTIPKTTTKNADFTTTNFTTDDVLRAKIEKAKDEVALIQATQPEEITFHTTSEPILQTPELERAPTVRIYQQNPFDRRTLLTVNVTELPNTIQLVNFSGQSTLVGLRDLETKLNRIVDLPTLSEDIKPRFRFELGMIQAMIKFKFPETVPLPPPDPRIAQLKSLAEALRRAKVFAGSRNRETREKGARDSTRLAAQIAVLNSQLAFEDILKGVDPAKTQAFIDKLKAEIKQGELLAAAFAADEAKGRTGSQADRNAAARAPKKAANAVKLNANRAMLAQLTGTKAPEKLSESEEIVSTECTKFVNIYTSITKDGGLTFTESLTSSGKIACDVLETLQNNVAWSRTHRVEIVEESGTQVIAGGAQPPQNPFFRDKAGNKIYKKDLIDSITIVETV